MLDDSEETNKNQNEIINYISISKNQENKLNAFDNDKISTFIKSFSSVLDDEINKMTSTEFFDKMEREDLTCSKMNLINLYKHSLSEVIENKIKEIHINFNLEEKIEKCIKTKEEAKELANDIQKILEEKKKQYLKDKKSLKQTNEKILKSYRTIEEKVKEKLKRKNGEYNKGDKEIIQQEKKMITYYIGEKRKLETFIDSYESFQNSKGGLDKTEKEINDLNRFSNEKCENLILFPENRFINKFLQKLIKLPKFFGKLLSCLQYDEKIKQEITLLKLPIEDIVNTVLNKIGKMNISKMMLTLTVNTGKTVFITGQILYLLFQTIRFGMKNNKIKYSKYAGQCFGLLFKLVLTWIGSRKF